MKKVQFKVSVMTGLFFILALGRGEICVLAQGASEESETSYTVAVLPFEANGEELKDLGPQVTLLINTYLSGNNSMFKFLVQRKDEEVVAESGNILGIQLLPKPSS